MSKIETTDDIYKVLSEAWDQNRMDLVVDTKVLFLDANENVIGVENVTTDNLFEVNGTELIESAQNAKASSFILARSNPELTPSIFCMDMAENLMDLSIKIGTPMVDYFLISSKGYYSYTLDEKFSIH